MSNQATAGSRTKAWLLFRSGALAGTRFPMPDVAVRVGRAPDNDVVIDGADSAVVSQYHAEIWRDADSFRVRDLGSTNGTWLNGERITEAAANPPAVLQLGSPGPEIALVTEEAGPSGLDRTIEIPYSAAGAAPPAPAPSIAAHEELLTSAVVRARRMRLHGIGGHTMDIMRDVVEQALRHSHRRLRVVGFSLAAALVVVTSLAAWKITGLQRQKRAIDAHIQTLEAQLQKPPAGADVDRLLSQLGDYQNEAEALQRNLLYRLGPRDDGDFVTRELRSLMAEFGAEVYSLPPDFVERVNYYIRQDQQAERPIVARALNQSADEIRTIRSILRQEQLPPDLAYIPLVESALSAHPRQSAAGAAGPWQLAAATARAYGLRVDAQVDERKNLVKSTHAICKYLRDLILDFGAGSSVMLALAAYDSGPAKVKQAVAKTVRDPIKQRSFWYLYRTRALPLETREYVPKVLAVMLIGRNPRRFGF
jgi:hypothetical protein